MNTPAKVRMRLDLSPFICTRCRLRQEVQSVRQLRNHKRRWTSSVAESDRASDNSSPRAGTSHQLAYARLLNRSIIRLQGPDVLDFLNGLLPAKLHPRPNSGSAPIFTTFLSAKGRILYEAFLYPPSVSDSEGSWYIDVDAVSHSALFSHLKKHKLRSKFKLEKITTENAGVYYIWPSEDDKGIMEKMLGGQDPRPLMGVRFIENSVKESHILPTLKQSGSTLSLEDYNIHRITCGHAEGPGELTPNSALPQESNIDFDGGIDFHKGCYLGQELTIRTHHTGVVRKRILPCQIYPADEKPFADEQQMVHDVSVAVHQPPSDANISKKNAKGRSGRSTGKWLGGVGNIGLALCRLEMMTDIQVTGEGTAFDPEGEFTVSWEEDEAGAEGKSAFREVKVKPFVPQWLRDNIQAGIKARSERSKRRRNEDEDDEDELD